MEFCIGDLVRFTPSAEVSPALMGLVGRVEGYEEVDGEDYVIVALRKDGLKFDQWVLPDEVVPAN